MAMKKLLLPEFAALFLATGAATLLMVTTARAQTHDADFRSSSHRHRQANCDCSEERRVEPVATLQPRRNALAK
jgi:hypothetical protein